MTEPWSFFHTIPWFAWIPILAIVGGITSGTVTKLIELHHRHKERMAMIRVGMHPDLPSVAEAELHECKPAAYQEL